LRIGAAIGAAVMAYHMGVPHRRTAPVSAGAIGWDASIGLRTVIHGPSTNAPSGAATNCTVGKLYSKPRQLLQITGRQLRVWGGRSRRQRLTIGHQCMLAYGAPHHQYPHHNHNHNCLSNRNHSHNKRCCLNGKTRQKR